MESDVITLQDIFVAKPPDEDSPLAEPPPSPSGTGLKPHFLEKMAANGVTLPPSFFLQDSDEEVRTTFQAASFGGSSDSPGGGRRLARRARVAPPAGRRAAATVEADTSDYPVVRAIFVTDRPTVKEPELTENGRR